MDGLKRLSVFLLLIVTLILGACGGTSDNTNETAVKEDGQEKNDSTGESNETSDEERDFSGPLISEDTPIDDRAALVETVERQKNVLKLGFITDEYPIENIQLAFYPTEDDFSYNAMYQLPSDSIGSFQYYVMSELDQSDFEEFIGKLKAPKALDHDLMEAHYGKYDDEHRNNYQLYGMADEVVHHIYAGRESEGYSDELIEAMGKSMRTDDHVYDPFYKNFALDLDKIKFPSINEERAEIYAFIISYWGGEDDDSRIQVTYNLGDGSLYYGINANPKEWYSDEVESGKTPEGIEVTEYSEGNDNRYFGWTDGTYSYHMQYNPPDKDAYDTEDIYKVIDSSINDDRTFEDTSFIQATIDKPQLTENEEEVNRLMKKIKDKGR